MVDFKQRGDDRIAAANDQGDVCLPGEVLVENYTQYLHSGGWLDSGAWYFNLEVSSFFVRRI